MTKKRTLIMVKVDPPIEQETEWNNWYNSKHIPDRLAIPGFLAARRFTKVEGISQSFIIPGEPKYLSLYDLTNTKVLKGEPYSKLREKEASLPPDSFENITFKLPGFARGVYEQLYPEQGEYKPPRTKFVFVVGHEIPRNKQKEFSAWYNTEHIPTVLRVPGFVTGRRFVLDEREIPPMLGSGGSLPKYLTVYDVENEKIFESEAFEKASVSPWSTWVRSWFTRKMCTLYHRIYPEE